MKKLFIIFIMTVVVGISQTYAKNPTITTKYQIQHNEKLKAFCKIEDLDRKANAIFGYFFKETIDEGLINYTVEDIQIIQKKHNGISNEDYTTIFGYPKNTTMSKREENVSIMLIDSICAYYGINIDELRKIRQSKHLINKKKKEINELFSNCLKTMNEKFIKDTKTITVNEDKLAELIAEKLIQKQKNESLIPTIPDCPPLI